jgi:hypothetical protein
MKTTGVVKARDHRAYPASGGGTPLIEIDDVAGRGVLEDRVQRAGWRRYRRDHRAERLVDASIMFFDRRPPRSGGARVDVAGQQVLLAAVNHAPHQSRPRDASTAAFVSAAMIARKCA